MKGWISREENNHLPDIQKKRMSGYELVLVGISGVAGGAINALAGGGTLITFPVLIAVGAPPIAANITNTVALCPGYLGGIYAQRKDLGSSKLIFWFLCPTGALGGIAGSILLLFTGEQLFSTLAPYLILLATVLLGIEGYLRKWFTYKADRETRHEAWTIFPVFLASVYGGYFGAGMSVIVLVILALVLHDTLIRLNALKQVTAFCVNITAALFFLFSGRVIWLAALVMATGAVAGGVIGGLLASKVRPAILRIILVITGTIVSIICFIR